MKTLNYISACVISAVLSSTALATATSNNYGSENKKETKEQNAPSKEQVKTDPIEINEDFFREAPSGIDEKTSKSKVVVRPPYPNPFVKTGYIELELSQIQFVTIKIYDALGNVAGIVTENQRFYAGSHVIPIDASNLKRGVYFYRVSTLTGFSAVDRICVQ